MWLLCGWSFGNAYGLRHKSLQPANGTLIASTFNDELITSLYVLVGMEMAANKVDCLLGPGMNIHRHPLNGRNFEYFQKIRF